LTEILIKRELKENGMTWKEFLEAFQREAMVEQSEKKGKAIKKKSNQKKKLPIPKIGKAPRTKVKKPQSKKSTCKEEQKIETPDPSNRLTRSSLRK